LEYEAQKGNDNAYQFEREAIKAALEAKDEPVAWADMGTRDVDNDAGISWSSGHFHTTPLYTTPPQRTWVGLTDEEIEKHWKKQVGTVRPNYSFTRAIEAKLKEKNELR